MNHLNLNFIFFNSRHTLNRIAKIIKTFFIAQINSFIKASLSCFTRRCHSQACMSLAGTKLICAGSKRSKSSAQQIYLLKVLL
jgi:hypothetical protein